MSKLIAVTGITGKQGGAVAKKLLEKGFKVRGITRNTTSPSAKKWTEQGVEMVTADMKDVESLKTAFAGVDSIFLITQLDFFNHKTEFNLGKNAVDAAKAAGVSFIVYTSVGNAQNAPKVPHFASKLQVEKYIREEVKIASTIVRPSFFMENYGPQSPMGSMASNGVVKGLNPSNVKIQMIAVDDIGMVAAEALANQDQFRNQIIELSGDELDGDETAATFTKVTGQKYKYSYWPFFRFCLRFILRDVSHMADFFQEVGYTADIPKLRQQFPELQTLETWLKNNGYAQQQ